MQKICLFFFSSRRRHTRLQGDWSSDVCSSDLFLDEQGKRRIFVVHDLLVLKQLEEAIVGNVFELRIVPAPEEHREGEKAESDRDQDDAAPIETRLVAAGLVLALGVTIGLWHKGCDYSRIQRLP